MIAWEYGQNPHLEHKNTATDEEKGRNFLKESIIILIIGLLILTLGCLESPEEMMLKERTKELARAEEISLYPLMER
ncbi:MAG: hypothetical protein GXO65_04355 [Euryarchaeota archaeon]|nr:hypothetical protein [Euryarchaeota archaeon]